MDELRRHYLGLMGIDVWEARVPATPVEEAREVHRVVAEKPPVSDTPMPPVMEEPLGERIPLAGERGAGEVPRVTGTSAPQVSVPPPAELDWDALQERVGGCTACDELVANRTQTVFGVGNRQADLMVIGEAPGADEDAQGEPFVGRAGKLLTAMLAAIGLKREQVYIANVLKCRPPNNRDPKPEEAEACAAYLERQIALIQPKAILVVGRIAAQNLLHTDSPLGKLRGRLHQLADGVPVIVTYHPAYLLRSPREKRKAWVDLCAAVDILAGQMPNVGE